MMRDFLNLLGSEVLGVELLDMEVFLMTTEACGVVVDANGVVKDEVGVFEELEFN